MCKGLKRKSGQTSPYSQDYFTILKEKMAEIKNRKFQLIFLPVMKKVEKRSQTGQTSPILLV